MNRLLVPGLAGSTIRGMSIKRLVACAALATLAGCSTPPRPTQTIAPDAPLASPSGWRSGIVDQAIREARERRFIRDLWRAGEASR
ncbi:MAG: hypothetical protein DYG93_04105 [Leptolyngbya sp. PLA2]|nr:hypothetical protein [Leptolyngbya sp.]MCE7970836.1 hypothetical protein [Leptolyngbya sp. PL-A2]MCQ3939991.1 hypothetical protein [cyanobacterium CYA1]